MTTYNKIIFLNREVAVNRELVEIQISRIKESVDAIQKLDITDLDRKILKEISNNLRHIAI